ncbi:transglutaminase domain-containing protein [Clostridium sp. DJ247]|uniref:transglutaminase domain-containing protein n=1 Tax=Clostridium sp. DJ247 TaxID=2726188 RepID=UPI001626B201|nr:transglutaminase domain-containing protein [Clostridium sp. DJ247]MBC2581216.1 hypothetical protein [Clostridium sp. DJ247]
MFNNKPFKIFLGITILSILTFSFLSYSVNGKISKSVNNSSTNNSAEVNNTIISNYDDYYNAVKKAMSNYDSSITLRIKNYNKKIYNLDVFNKILESTPELNGICIKASSTVKFSIPIKLIINFEYIDSKENLKSKDKIVHEKIQQIVNSVIKPGMRDYEKEAALHDYIINNSKYDNRFYTGNMPKESNTAYGILIKGIGVCQGYAEAMDMLLKAVGIESILVIGDANDSKNWISHAWNIVKIGGEYYHLDTTWDDPTTRDGSNHLRHSYFNVTDEQISKNHRWDRSKYPKCINTQYNFNNLNLVEKDESGNIITVVKNYSEFYKTIKNALGNSTTSVSIKILNYDGNIYDVEQCVSKAYDALKRGGKFSWVSYNDELNNSKYITIDFQ